MVGKTLPNVAFLPPSSAPPTPPSSAHATAAFHRLASTSWFCVEALASPTARPTSAVHRLASTSWFCAEALASPTAPSHTPYPARRASERRLVDILLNFL